DAHCPARLNVECARSALRAGVNIAANCKAPGHRPCRTSPGNGDIPSASDEPTDISVFALNAAAVSDVKCSVAAGTHVQFVCIDHLRIQASDGDRATDSHGFANLTESVLNATASGNI